MIPTPIAPLLAALLAAFASLYSSGAEASDFASTRPAARVEYWQTRQAAIDAQVADTASLRAVKLVFVGDSITDFWLLGDDTWMPGRLHGRSVWDESFGGAVPQNLALNIAHKQFPAAPRFGQPGAGARVLRADGRHQQFLRS